MPHKGGLPHGKIMTDEGAVAKEQLALCRLANAGNDSGDAGYQINNLSRADRKAPSTSQEISFSDSLLFDGGLAKDVQHTDKAFDGENIELRYGVSVAGEGAGEQAVRTRTIPAINNTTKHIILSFLCFHFLFLFTHWRFFQP